MFAGSLFFSSNDDLVDVFIKLFNSFLLELSEEVERLDHFVLDGVNPVDIFTSDNHNDVLVVAKAALIYRNFLVWVEAG